MQKPTCAGKYLSLLNSGTSLKKTGATQQTFARSEPRVVPRFIWVSVEAHRRCYEILYWQDSYRDSASFGLD
jgi:hypothetical protein